MSVKANVFDYMMLALASGLNFQISFLKQWQGSYKETSENKEVSIIL